MAGTVLASFAGEPGGLEWSRIGVVSEYSGFRSWCPRHAIGYYWAHANEWRDPSGEYGLSRCENSAIGFVAEGMNLEAIKAAAGVRTTEINDISLLYSIPQAAIDEFKAGNQPSTSSRLLESYTWDIIAIESSGQDWYSYAGIYLLWGDYVRTWAQSKLTRIWYRLSRASCLDKDNPPSGSIVVDADCGKPLPYGSPGGGGDSSGGGSARYQRNKKRRELIEMNGCCSCASIADMLAQQTANIKEMFDKQNIEIGETLTEQTQFLQDQIIATIPKGFDYQPIFNKIEDARNDIWNGLNK